MKQRIFKHRVKERCLQDGYSRLIIQAGIRENNNSLYGPSERTWHSLERLKNFLLKINGREKNGRTKTGVKKSRKVWVIPNACLKRKYYTLDNTKTKNTTKIVLRNTNTLLNNTKNSKRFQPQKTSNLNHLYTLFTTTLITIYLMHIIDQCQFKKSELSN